MHLPRLPPPWAWWRDTGEGFGAGHEHTLFPSSDENLPQECIEFEDGTQDCKPCGWCTDEYDETNVATLKPPAPSSSKVKPKSRAQGMLEEKHAAYVVRKKWKLRPHIHSPTHPLTHLFCLEKSDMYSKREFSPGRRRTKLYAASSSHSRLLAHAHACSPCLLKAPPLVQSIISMSASLTCEF